MNQTPYNIEALLAYGLENRMIEKWDVPQVRNQLLALLQEKEPYDGTADSSAAGCHRDGPFGTPA